MFRATRGFRRSDGVRAVGSMRGAPLSTRAGTTRHRPPHVLRVSATHFVLFWSAVSTLGFLQLKLSFAKLFFQFFFVAHGTTYPSKGFALCLPFPLRFLAGFKGCVLLLFLEPRPLLNGHVVGVQGRTTFLALHARPFRHVLLVFGSVLLSPQVACGSMVFLHGSGTQRSRCHHAYTHIYTALSYAEAPHAPALAVQPVVQCKHWLCITHGALRSERLVLPCAIFTKDVPTKASHQQLVHSNFAVFKNFARHRSV